MEGLSFGIPSVVCPTFGDQPVNAAKLTKLGIGLGVARPTSAAAGVAVAYRREVARAVKTVLHDSSRSFAAAATRLQMQVAAGGGEAAAEEVLRTAASKLAAGVAALAISGDRA